jgi:hypothetical protein
MTQNHDCIYLEDLKFVQSQYNALCCLLESLRIQEVNNVVSYVSCHPSEAIDNVKKQLSIDQYINEKTENEDCATFDNFYEKHVETENMIDYDDIPPLESIDKQESESTFDYNIFEPFSKEFIDNVYEFAQSNLKFALNQYDSKTKTYYNIDAREFPKIFAIGISTGTKTKFEWCYHKFGPYLNVPRSYVMYWNDTHFVKYDDDTTYEILNAKTCGAKKIIITIFNVDYEIDLVNMIQKNIKTGFKRNIVIETY